MASESEYDFPVEEQIRMALQRLPYPAQLEALGATYEYNAPEDVQIQMFLERARADCAAMAAKSGEDVEQYTQRMMKSFIARLKKRCCPETSEKQSGVSDEASGVDAFYGQRQSPRPAAVCLPPKHDEISSSSLQTDVLQPDPHQNTEGQVQEDTNILLEGSHQLTARSSPAHATGENSELKQKETIASEDSGLGTNAPMTALGKDGAMRDASKAAPEMPLTTNEGAVGSDMALADASTKASSTSLNPWSRFAKAPDVGGFTKKTLSNPPTHINRRSSTGEATCNVFAKMYRQRSRPDHLNEHVVNNQRSAIMRTPYRSNDEDALDFPTTCPTRHLGNSSAHSLKDARLTSLVDKAEKGNDLAIGEKEFFGGLHPSRLGQISNQGESEPAACYSQSHDNKAEKVGRSKTYILTSANGQQTTSTTRDKERTYNQTAEKVKGPRLKTKGNAGTALNLEPRFKGLSNNTVQLFIDAVENLKKRYAHLRLISNGDKKDWVFAWQEITAIFRTSSNYNYIPCRGGFKLQLHTDFKVFSLRGPFETKATGKDIITRKAVLHVLDGPYFFRQAVPALEDFCRTNGFPRPVYAHRLHSDNTYACSVSVGTKPSIFGDDEEGYGSRKEAEEDTAKKAMNAIHREGLLCGNSQRVEKRKASGDMMEKDSRRVSARVGDYADPDALNSKTRRDAEVRHNISVKSEINDDAKLVDTWPTLGFLPSSQLTRADLAKVLEGVFEPQERVDAMCGYLRIQKPQYIIQGHSGGESWSAQFERTTHDSIACITVARAKSLQHCAKLVEQKLFEKIYSSEIQLGDGDAKFPDPAMDYERHRQYFAQLKAKERKRREADEGLTLEEIGRRAEGQGEISLPPSANSVPLGISRRSLVRDHSLDEETGYDSGDQLHPSKMILEDVDELICEARGCDPSDLIESGPAGHSGSPLNTSTFEQRRRNASKQPRPSENSEANNHTHEAAPSTNIWPPWDQVSPRPAREPRLLPSGELPYVSPPPFLDTPVQSRPLSVQAGAGAAVVKVEPAQIEKAVAVKIEGVEEEEAIVVEREPREGNLEEGEIEG